MFAKYFIYILYILYGLFVMHLGLYKSIFGLWSVVLVIQVIASN